MDLSNWGGENKSSFKTTYHAKVPTAERLLQGRRRANRTVLMEFLHPNAIGAGAKEANSSFQKPRQPRLTCSPVPEHAQLRPCHVAGGKNVLFSL